MCEMNGSHAEVGENALFVFDNYVKITLYSNIYAIPELKPKIILGG
jgi:hypothetical protein